MDIVYASDGGFAKVAGVSLLSLLLAHKDVNILIHFLDAGLSDESKSELEKIVLENSSSAHICFYDVKNCIEAIKDNIPAMGSSYATYARLFIERLLPENIEKCLYIDCDTFIAGSVSEIFEDTDVFPLYMAYDLVPQFHKRDIGLDFDAPYFNAGVCLFNLRRWRECNATQKVLDLLQSKVTFRFHDQDILNILFKGQIGLLDLRFNVMSQNIYFGSSWHCRWLYGMNREKFYSSKTYKKALKNPVIYHLTSVPFLVRPWIYHSNHPVRSLYDDLKNSNKWLANFTVYKEFSRRQIILQKICAGAPKVFSAFLFTVLHKIFYKRESI